MSHSVNKSADELVKQFWLILKCLSLDWMFFILWNDLGSMKAIYVFNSVFFDFLDVKLTYQILWSKFIDLFIISKLLHFTKIVPIYIYSIL